MENLKGKTAFITGAASGIGLGIAKACGRAGMNVVIADLRQHAIDAVIPFFKENGWPVHGIQLNVTDREGYAKAAEEAESVFGNIHVLINNAGVEAPMGPLWKNSFKDVDFIVGVNITGVLNGILTILPRILAHGEGGHIVTTASQSGLTVVPGASLYCMTKAAVIGLMETLACDLQGTDVGASAFVPGPVRGNLGANSKEVRPDDLKNDAPEAPRPARKTDGGPAPDFDSLLMSSEESGERVVRGIRNKDLYIFTHPEFKDVVRAKTDAIIRAYPDQPENLQLKQTFSFLTSNPIYDTQKQVNGPDWE